MRQHAIVLLALLLGGCNGNVGYLVTQKYIVVEIPPDLVQCQLVNLPDYKALTDRQVAKLLVTLYKNNVDCKTSVDAILKYIADAKATVEK